MHEAARLEAPSLEVRLNLNQHMQHESKASTRHTGVGCQGLLDSVIR